MATYCEQVPLSTYWDDRARLTPVLYVNFMCLCIFWSTVYICRIASWAAPSLCISCRYLSGRLPGENPPVATASTQSRERLAALKQALRALGFNKQVLNGTAYSFCWTCLYQSALNHQCSNVLLTCVPHMDAGCTPPCGTVLSQDSPCGKIFSFFL